MGSWDHTARLWDAATGQRRGVPLRHHGAIRAVAFGPDGRWVLTREDIDAHAANLPTGVDRGHLSQLGSIHA